MQKRPRKSNQEDNLQKSVIIYLKLQHPNIIATSESAGRGSNLIQEVNAKLLRTADGLPDLLILHKNSQYNGLFLELKKSGTSVLKKDGTLLANEHLKQQHQTLARLREQGYYADFSIGFDETKTIIDAYLSNVSISPKYIPNPTK
jgi:hypothetical protein